MKKFIAILALVCFSATMIFAQNAKPASKEQVTTTTEVKAAKADANKAKADASSAVAPTKKDGTPDLHYKANKDAAVPTKKDGTPDLRYKANKEAPAKPK